MLNNIMNSISVSGDQRTMDEMLKAINSYDDPFEIIDFNTVIPIPESLMIESNCITSRGLQAYKDFIYVYTLAGTRKDADLENIPEESENCASGITAIYARKDSTPEPLKAFLKELRPVLNIPPAHMRSFLL